MPYSLGEVVNYCKEIIRLLQKGFTMQTQWIKCRVDGDLINMSHIREISKPTYYLHTDWYHRQADSKDIENAQEVSRTTPVNHIEIEFAYPDADGIVKRCSIFIGSKDECQDFRYLIEERIIDGTPII